MLHPAVFGESVESYSIPTTSIGHEVFLTFVFGGMIAGARALYASYFPAFLAFSLPAATPLTLLFFSRGRFLACQHGGDGAPLHHYHDYDNKT